MIKTCWDLSQMYESKVYFENDYRDLESLFHRLLEFKGKLGSKDKAVLLEYFELDSKFSALLEKMYVYARCKNDDDGKNNENVRNFSKISNFYSLAVEKLAFDMPELTSLDDEFLTELASDPDFKDYSRRLEHIIRDKKHTLTEREESILAMVGDFCSFDDIYSTISDIEMGHGEVIDPAGNKIKLTTGNYNLLLKNPDQNFRKKVSDTYLGEYKNFNLTISNLYISHVKASNFGAKLRGFGSEFEKECFYEEVPSDVMFKNIEYIEKNKHLISEYFDLKRKILGLDKFYTCDISMNIIPSGKKTEFEDCIGDIRAAFAPLGKDYQEKFDEALAEGWIDAFPRDNKASGGYTISTYLSHPYILLNFDGTEYWKSGIAHEFGHAMHSYYSCQSQPYPKCDYTIFVAEVASLTNEILLSNYLLEKETDKNTRMLILSEFLSLFYLNVFNSTMLSELELYVHNSTWENKNITAEDINNFYKTLCEKYFEGSVTLTDNFEFDWERKSHIFRDYYLYKYSTGLISACAAAKKILSDKTGEYVKKYKKFLSLGGSMDPVSSLLVAEIDITSEETYNFAFKMFEDYLKELKTLYEENL